MRSGNTVHRSQNKNNNFKKHVMKHEVFNKNDRKDNLIEGNFKNIWNI